MSGQRVSIPEAAKMAGVSIPTINRRIKSGELKAALCIDQKGKHWEVYASSLESLQLKHKRSSANVAEPGGGEELELTAVTAQVADAGNPVASPASLKTASTWAASQAGPVSSDETWSALWERLRCCEELLKDSHAEAAKWRSVAEIREKDVRELRVELKEARQELALANEDGAYWKGRWEEVYASFETLKKYANQEIANEESDLDLDDLTVIPEE